MEGTHVLLRRPVWGRFFSEKRLSELTSQLGKLDTAQVIVFEEGEFILRGKDSKVNDISIDLSPWNLLSFMIEDDIRLLLQSDVDVDGLGVQSLRTQLRRNLYVNFRLSLSDFTIKFVNLQPPGSPLAVLGQQIIDKVDEHEKREVAVRIASATGHHVAKTTRSNYVTGNFVPQDLRDAKIPIHEFQLCLLGLQMMALITEYPFSLSVDAGGGMPWEQRSSLAILRTTEKFREFSDNQFYDDVKAEIALVTEELIHEGAVYHKSQYDVVPNPKL